MCVVGSFRWQCVLLGFLGDNVGFCMFQVAMCLDGSFRWQCVLFGLLGGNICCFMF